jgi:hypothetical protein
VAFQGAKCGDQEFGGGVAEQKIPASTVNFLSCVCDSSAQKAPFSASKLRPSSLDTSYTTFTTDIYGRYTVESIALDRGKPSRTALLGQTALSLSHNGHGARSSSRILTLK